MLNNLTIKCTTLKDNKANAIDELTYYNRINELQGKLAKRDTVIYMLDTDLINTCDNKEEPLYLRLVVDPNHSPRSPRPIYDNIFNIYTKTITFKQKEYIINYRLNDIKYSVFKLYRELVTIYCVGDYDNNVNSDVLLKNNYDVQTIYLDNKYDFVYNKLDFSTPMYISCHVNMTMVQFIAIVQNIFYNIK